jgi:nitroreductase
MDLLELIKKRHAIRKYKDTPIPDNLIEKVIEAGRWSSCVLGCQPWRFVVITNHSLIKKIASVLVEKSKVTGSGLDKLLSLTARTIANSPLLILIYDKNIFKKTSYRVFNLKKRGKKIAELTEIQAISGAIQNMLLVADNLGIGACWNTMPLFCEKEINKLLGNSEQLVSILTLGYPDEKGKRTKRKTIDEVVQYRY